MKKPDLASTRAKALDLRDDLQHMREVVAKKPVTSGDLRRMSSTLRRLLLDEGGELPVVASPRLQRRVRLSSPDLELLRDDWDEGMPYFASLGASRIFGSKAEVFTMNLTWQQPFVGADEKIKMYGQKGEPDQTLVEMPVRKFLAQKVLYFAGEWFDREEVLKHVANKAGGVHSANLKSDQDLKIHRLRQLFSFHGEAGEMSLRFNIKSFRETTTEIDVNAFGVDFALVHVMAMGRYITISPDILELERVIDDEFNR